MAISEYINKIEMYTESAFAEYELSLILNESNDNKTDSANNNNSFNMPSQPKKTLSQKLINGIHRFIELIKRICRSIVNLYNRIKNYIKESFVAIDTIEYSAVLLKRPPLLKPIAPDNVERQAMILEPYNNMCQTKRKIKKGERIPSVLIQNAKEWAVTDVLVKTNNDDEWKKYASKWGDSITYSYNVMNYAANITNTAYDFLRKIEICFATKDGTTSLW